MKRITLLVILCVVIVSTSFSQDFRKHSWGDSKAQVKAKEGDKEWEEESFEDFHTGIAFEGNVGGLEAMIVFYFVENQLYSGRYIFLEEHESNSSNVKDFESIDMNLQDKYGSTKIEEIWESEEREKDRSSWGYEIMMGFLSIYTDWMVPEDAPVTEITHYLYSEDFIFIHMLDYDSIVLGARLESLREAENVF